MKFLYLLLSFVSWIIGLFLMLVAIVGVFSEDNIGDMIIGVVVSLLISFAFIWLGVTMSRKAKRLGFKVISDEKINKLLIAADEKERKSNVKNKIRPMNNGIAYSNVAFNIKNKGVQLLESLYVLYTTKNMDTLKGRFDFIDHMYSSFVEASCDRRYISDVQESIDIYKSMYYDRVLYDFQVQLISVPSRSLLQEYYIGCVYNCFCRFLEEQETQIAALKRDSAKQNRIKRIVDIADEAILEIDSYAVNKQQSQSYIDDITTKRNKYLIK